MEGERGQVLESDPQQDERKHEANTRHLCGVGEKKKNRKESSG